MHTKKRILHVVGGMNMGGVETLMMNILRSEMRHKYDFIFLCYIDGKYDYEDEAISLGATIIRIDDNRISNPLRFIADIKDTILDQRIDIVHSHVDFSTGYVMVAARHAGVVVRIAHSHNSSVTRSKNILRHAWFNLLKVLINVNATHRIACGELAGRYMYGRKKFKILKNGIDMDEFYFDQYLRDETRKELGISREDFMMLHVGRFEHAKNHAYLLQVFKAYIQKHQSSYLVLVGDGSLYTKVKLLVRDMGLSNNVHMLGKKDSMSKYYSAADCFVMPSLHEGAPVSLVEAQASGLACVVSDAIDATVSYGEMVFVPLSSSPDSWASCIYKKDLEHRKDVSKLFIKENSILSSLENLEKIYEG